jgi:NADH:ubiquinone oxidoreductase subunit 4 (subunit M)
MVFSAVYCLWLYNRIIFGELKNMSLLFIPLKTDIKYNLLFFKKWFSKFTDLVKREFFILFPFFVVNIVLGIYPNVIFNFSYISLINLIQ